MITMGARRTLAAAAGIVMLAGSAAVGMVPSAGASEVTRDGTVRVGNTDSAVTKSGDGESSGLKVTVSQTAGLVNQVVRVSWTGGKPTKPEFGNLGINYLQIMQCWGGSKEDGPPREKCQYGGQRAWNGGQNTNSRQLTTSGVEDPAEKSPKEWNIDGISYVPFQSWTGKETLGPKSEFFDRYTSNEVNHARIRPDGTGEEFFEVQTGVESPGLGCGQSRDGETPLCWLVVVPRGSTEVDGSERGTTNGNPLDTTPLSTTNWANRIVFPLEFQAIGTACPIGRDEIPLLGTDRVAEAISRWQPALCADGDGNFSYVVLGDEAARQKSQSAKPDLTFVERGMSPDAVSAQHPVVYAPVALSGVTISFNLESQSSSLAPDDVRRRDGQRLSGIKLNQRLVAKLLTQTYRYDAAPDPKKVEKNPWDLSTDPEFLQLNPQFKDLRIPALGHILTPSGESDTARLVWEWIWADKDARDFLEGKPDDWGARINPAYKNTTFPRSDFPRADNVCAKYADRAVEMCTFDLVPYSLDLYSGARAASRGDTLSTGIYDPTSVPPGNKRTPTQEPGKRAIITLADSALTGRFALNAALLRNAAGEYVAPTDASISSAGAAAVATDVKGVAQPDPAKKVAGAYPLASYVYAMTSPPSLTKELAAEYARFLTYAVGPGQQVGDGPGELPAGYVPLPDKARAQTTAVAAAIVEAAGKAIPAEDTTDDGTDTSTDTSTDTDASTDTSTDTSSDTTYTDTTYTDTTYTDTSVTDASDGTVADPGADGATDAAGAEEVVAVVADDSLVAAATPLTPSTPLGAVRYLIVLLLFAGGAALLASAILGQRLLQARAAGPGDPGTT